MALSINKMNINVSVNDTSESSHKQSARKQDSLLYIDNVEQQVSEKLLVNKCVSAALDALNRLKEP
ncbi:hypothetical protein H0A36_13250 [Endozoicomonas sp. SM1973]|uniref:Uncharacterized protein n=1 Tax=Spartinivicinus marinus TaxID=2994442 RepID=A0A853I5U7_9GAMM|nr:hypothetical protein [Spartinivicinus marinus]MCX4029637.1 hypothetical protein [Spartinivicinus marinus]NYZ66982.1 hypothetical protein [Spartinivicinus marinus]